MSKVICIDRGHGGGSGARSGKFVEDNLIAVTADECVKVLKEAGFKVVQTRTEDVNVSFEHRHNVSNNNKADLFISIHYNSGGGEGFECIRTLRDNIVTVGIANNIIKRLPSIGHVKRPNPIYTRTGTGGKDYYSVLRGTKCPALILEGAFIDNSKDAKRIDSNDKLRAIGRIYAEAIIEYYGGKIPQKQTNSIIVDDPKTHTIGTVKVNIDSCLSVREMPTTESKIIDKLLNGTKVNLLYPVDKDWWAISYDNTKCSGVAFVNKEFLKTE